MRTKLSVDPIRRANFFPHQIRSPFLPYVYVHQGHSGETYPTVGGNTLLFFLLLLIFDFFFTLLFLIYFVGGHIGMYSKKKFLLYPIISSRLWARICCSFPRRVISL